MDATEGADRYRREGSCELPGCDHALSFYGTPVCELNQEGLQALADYAEERQQEALKSEPPTTE